MEKDNFNTNTLDGFFTTSTSYYQSHTAPQAKNANNLKKEKNINNFYNGLERHYIDVKEFHIAFDDELNKLNLLNLFSEDGLLKSKSTYGIIKNYLTSSSDNRVLNALLKFWNAQYNNLLPTKEEKINDFKKELDN